MVMRDVSHQTKVINILLPDNVSTSQNLIKSYDLGNVVYSDNSHQHSSLH